MAPVELDLDQSAGINHCTDKSPQLVADRGFDTRRVCIQGLAFMDGSLHLC